MAQVEYTKGATINMGDFESIKTSVGITLDCPNEEVGEKLQEAKDIVNEQYRTEVKEMIEKKKNRARKNKDD